MDYIPSETPPTERRTPMRESTKTVLLVLAVLLAGVGLGAMLQNAGPGQVMTGVAFLVGALWLFSLGIRGARPTGTDGHGRQDAERLSRPAERPPRRP